MSTLLIYRTVRGYELSTQAPHGRHDGTRNSEVAELNSYASPVTHVYRDPVSFSRRYIATRDVDDRYRDVNERCIAGGREKAYVFYR